MTYERDYALMEGHRNAASEEYFRAREKAGIKVTAERAYDDAYARAWAERAQPAPQAGVADTVALAPSRRGRVYLAGPMTGYSDFNFPAFNAAAAKIRAAGIEVVNPAEHGVVDGAEWADYLRFDIAKIAVCESIALLPGWSKSRGAQLEVHVAQALGMPMQFLDGAEQAAHPTAQPSQDAEQALGCLNWIDDFIARCNGDDRGACESVNVVRRFIATQASGAGGKS